MRTETDEDAYVHHGLKPNFFGLRRGGISIYLLSFRTICIPKLTYIAVDFNWHCYFGLKNIKSAG